MKPCFILIFGVSTGDMLKGVQSAPDGFHRCPTMRTHIYLLAVKAILGVISAYSSPCDLESLLNSQNHLQAPIPHLLSSVDHESPRQSNI